MDEQEPGGRPSARRRRTRHDIEAVLRQRIDDGTYAPGSRMPTHRILVSEFGISSATLQHAFDRLAEFGFVESRGSLGTFVSGSPLGRLCTALVFPEEPNQGSWNRFLATILRSAMVDGDGRRTGRFRPYFIRGGRPDSDGAKALLSDARSGVLAGIAFVHTPYYLGAELFELPVPRVVVGGGSPSECERYRASFVRLHATGLHDRLLGSFVAAGRRRLAVLMASQHDLDAMPGHAARAGLQVRPEWNLRLPVDPESAVSARTIMHLLFSKPRDDRPDCLLIEDDNLVPHATAGIVAAGIPPVDLSVAAHANFPDVTRAMFPCQRFGYDVGRITAHMLEEIARLAGGASVRDITVKAEMRSAAP